MQNENDVTLPGFGPLLSVISLLPSFFICSKVVIVVSNPGTYSVSQLIHTHCVNRVQKLQGC